MWLQVDDSLVIWHLAAADFFSDDVLGSFDNFLTFAPYHPDVGIDLAAQFEKAVLVIDSTSYI
jgi:hypothetical protein